jgi:EamA domain-containing membrane protein RarD
MGLAPVYRKLLTFVLIWVALMIYSADAVVRWRAVKAIGPAPPV